MKAVLPEMLHVTFVFSSNITHELNCYNCKQEAIGSGKKR